MISEICDNKPFYIWSCIPSSNVYSVVLCDEKQNSSKHSYVVLARCRTLAFTTLDHTVLLGYHVMNVTNSLLTKCKTCSVLTTIRIHCEMNYITFDFDLCIKVTQFNFLLAFMVIMWWNFWQNWSSRSEFIAKWIIWPWILTFNFVVKVIDNKIPPSILSHIFGPILNKIGPAIFEKNVSCLKKRKNNNNNKCRARTVVQ